MSSTTPITTPSAEGGSLHGHRPSLMRALTILAGCYGLALAAYLMLRFTLGDSLWWLALLNTFTPYYFLPLLVWIPLLLLGHTRRMAVRLVPLLLIGVLLYGPRWLPHTVAAAADDTRALKVVTFNILVLTRQFDRMADWLDSTGADVILLQEVGGVDPQSVIDRMQGDYPYAVNLTGTTVMALSRFPVANADLVDLDGWFIDRFELDVEGQTLAVYNVHMDWPILREARFPLVVHNEMAQLVLQYDETHRNHLLRNLLAVLDRETLPYLVAGDFNTSDNSLIYGELAAAMGDSFRETSAGLGTTWPAARGDDDIPALIPPVLRLDYIWHSRQLRALSTEIGPDLGSDHLPVVAVLALPA